MKRTQYGFICDGVADDSPERKRYQVVGLHQVVLDDITNRPPDTGSAYLLSLSATEFRP